MCFKEGCIDKTLNFISFFLGGGYIGSMYAEGGVANCVQSEYKGGGGSKKAEKLRTYYVHVPLIFFATIASW